MLFNIYIEKAIPIEIILVNFNINDFHKLSIIDKKFNLYLKKHISALYLNDFIYLAKKQIRRPICPNLYSHMCGIDIFTPLKPKNKIMNDYHLSKNFFKRNMYCNILEENGFYCYSLLPLDVNLKTIINFTSAVADKKYRKLDYYICLYNYQSLGVSPIKSHIFSVYGGDWFYYKNNYNPCKTEDPYVFYGDQYKFYKSRWSKYEIWKKKNYKYMIKQN